VIRPCDVVAGGNRGVIPIKIAPACRMCGTTLHGSATCSERCSGAKRSITSNTCASLAAWISQVRSASTRSTISPRPVSRAKSPLSNAATASSVGGCATPPHARERSCSACAISSPATKSGRRVRRTPPELRRTGQPIDPAHAEDLTFRLGNVDVSGPDDLVDLGNRRGSEGERPHGLRPAGGIKFVYLAQAARVEDRRVDRTIALRRRRHDDALDAGDFGRHDVIRTVEGNDALPPGT